MKVLEFSKKFPFIRLKETVSDSSDTLLIFPDGNIVLADSNALYTGWVYGAVNIIANAIQAVPWKIINGRGEELPDHPLARVLRRPAPLSTYIDLIRRTVIHLELMGESYWVLNTNRYGMLKEILILPNPRLVRKVINRNGEFVGIIYGLGREEVSFKVDELVFLRYPHPFKMYDGYPPLRAVMDDVITDAEMRNFQKHFFKNNAVPPMVIETDAPLTDKQKDLLLKKWERLYRGSDKAGRVAILSRMKVQPITLSPQEIQFLESRRFSRDLILQVWGIPPSKLGIVEDVNRANAEANDFTFAKEVILPRLSMIESYIQTQIVERFFDRDGITFRFESPIPADKEYELRKTDVFLRNAVLSPNEVRVREGLTPKDWGRTPYLPSSYLPVGTGADLKTLQPSLVVSKEPVNIWGIARNNINERVRDLIWRDYMKVILPLEHRLAAWWKRYFRMQREEVLNGLDIRGRADVINLDLNKYENMISGELLPILVEGFKRGIRRAASLAGLNVDVDVNSTRAFQELLLGSILKPREISTHTISLIEAALREGGDDPEQRVREVFEYCINTRSGTIARTQASGAIHAGMQFFMTRNADIITGKMWISSRGERARKGHIEADGQVVGVESSFVVGSSSFIHPGDPAAPPGEIVNCHCTMIPVIQEGE